MLCHFSACTGLFVVLGWCVGSGYGLGTFGFDFYHRFSDAIKEILAADGPPAKGSVSYFNDMVHRGRLIRARRLAQANGQTPVTFLGGNETYRLNALGYCGQVQTGSFLNGAAPNGLLGLGMDNLSVPSILAGEKVATNSFSICFAPDGHGRIQFGDRGKSDQGETAFNLRKLHPTYNVSVTQISVGGNSGNLNFTAIFDSGTSFTYLNDPAYAQLSESFDKLALDKRYTFTSYLPFEFCYEISSNQDSFKYPLVNLTMKGGDQFSIKDPVVLVPLEDGDVYCLGVVKSDDLNIIGQNFMTGYRIVFDRERMVLGWKEFDCKPGNDIEKPNRPVKPPTAAAPAVAVKPQPTARNRNDSHISGAPPSSLSFCPSNSFCYALLIGLLRCLLLM